MEGDNVGGMAGDTLFKKATHTGAGTPLRDCSLRRSHTKAATLGSLEEHSLGSKEQQIKTIKHTQPQRPVPPITSPKGLSITCSEGSGDYEGGRRRV